MEEKSEYYFENSVRMRGLEGTGVGAQLPVVEAFFPCGGPDFRQRGTLLSPKLQPIGFPLTVRLMPLIKRT